MKKTKLAVLFTAFMTVLGLSSCLGEQDPFFTTTEIMRVNGVVGFYSFKSASGFVVEPTNSDALTSNIGTDFAWVTYKYDSRTVTSNLQRLDAEIQYLLPIKEIYNGTGTSNAAMRTVSESIKFYDKTNIFIDLTYYYNKTNDQDDLNEELQSHNFYLEKATPEEDEDVTDDTMVLNLIHNVADAENNDDRDDVGSETRHFNLGYILGGSEPEKIIIKYKQNSSGIELNDNARDGQIEINYKKIIDEYFNTNSGSGI